MAGKASTKALKVPSADMVITEYLRGPVAPGDVKRCIRCGAWFGADDAREQWTRYDGQGLAAISVARHTRDCKPMLAAEGKLAPGS